jgi:phospholipid transport system substrate-binding protein
LDLIPAQTFKISKYSLDYPDTQMNFLAKRMGTACLPLFTIIALMVSPAMAGEALLPPQKVIQETSEQVKEALRKDDYKIDFAKATRIVKEILEPHVDVNRAALLILGKHWRTATPDQRERFKNEFRTMLIRTYTTAFSEFKAFEISHLPLEMAPSDDKVTVRTEIRQSGTPQPVPVSYRMENAGGEWKVYDVMISGVSLVQNYRTTFGSEIARTGSLEAVIKNLAERNAAALSKAMNGQGNPPSKDS